MCDSSWVRLFLFHVCLMLNVEVSFPSELSFGICFFIYLHSPGDAAVSPSLLPRKEVVVLL